MKKRATLITLIGMITLTFIIFQSCKKEEAEKNQPPRIQSLTSTPSTSSNNRLSAGESVTITVTATDVDKDNLSYSWDADGGNFEGDLDRASIIWIAPTITSDKSFSIICNVSDGAATDEDGIKIYVAKTIPGIAILPDNLDFGNNIDQLTLKLFNTGDGTLDWETYQESFSYITVTPSTGTLQNNTDTAIVTINLNRDNLSPNTYSNSFYFRDKNDINTKQKVNVLFEVSENATLEGYTYYSGTTVPVSGVTVNNGLSSYTTGTDGYYLFENIPAETYSITATKDGYDGYAMNVDIQGGNNNHTIELTSALYTHNLYGNITNSNTGESIAGVTVAVKNPDGSLSQLTTESDFNGYYQIPTVPQGTRKIIFKYDMYDSLEVELFISNSNYNFDAQLNPETIILSGIYSEDILLRKLNSPIYVENASFYDDYVLTIEPGVVLLFNDNGSLRGEIIAIGTETDKIIFKHKDYENQPGRWDLIILNSNCEFAHCIINGGKGFSSDQWNNSYSEFSYVTVEYCTNGFFAAGYPLQYASSELYQCTIRNIPGTGISAMVRRDLSVNDCIIENCGIGVYSGGNNEHPPSESNIKDCYIKNNVIGIEIHQYKRNENNFQYCEISENGTGIYIHGSPLNSYIENGSVHKCIIQNNDIAIESEISQTGYSYDIPFLTENNIINNSQYITYDSYMYDEGDCIAEQNWWGADPPDASKFVVLDDGEIDYTPWLTGEVPDAGPRTK